VKAVEYNVLTEEAVWGRSELEGACRAIMARREGQLGFEWSPMRNQGRSELELYAQRSSESPPTQFLVDQSQREQRIRPCLCDGSA